MKITIEIPPEMEERLRERAAARDAVAVRQLLTEVVAETVEALLRDPERFVRRADGLTDIEYDTLLDELDRLPPPRESPNISFTREEIYEDHP